MNNLISIITPSYNSEKFIGKTIESVLAQTYQNWEMIIVDDKSTDNSLDIIKNYTEKDQRIRLIKLNNNAGVANARNKAILECKGDYIAFLDSDDLWLPEKLEKQLNFMLENHYAFTYLAYEKINSKGKVIGKVNAPKKIFYHDLLKTCYPGCLTVMIDVKVLKGMLIPLGTKREDYAFWLKIIKHTHYAFGLDQVLAQYRLHPDQNSRIKLHMAKETWNLYRDIERLSFFKTMYYFSNYAIRGVLRKYKI
jgi:glycosyltransferase involved in cell wall biosynthesis